MDDLVRSLRRFVKERDWDKYHSPKNLSMALSKETAEIVELFQWLTQEESYDLTPEKRTRLADEIGDVLIYLAMLADKLDISPMDAAKEKLKKNIEKYPTDKVKGKSDKYTEYT